MSEPPAAPPGATPGPDGLLRCPWALGSADYLAYHDEEWGRPVRSDAGIFERLSLEAFQSGLSWLTILRKRENFRAAFGGFDPHGQYRGQSVCRGQATAPTSPAAFRTVSATKSTILPRAICQHLLWSFA